MQRNIYIDSWGNTFITNSYFQALSLDWKKIAQEDKIYQFLP